MSNTKSKLQSIILESVILNEDSVIAQKAKAMGLHYVGFGRWSDGRMTYKSDGINLNPMDKTQKKESHKDDWITKFINHSNENAINYKSAQKLFQYMVKALPDSEWGKDWGTKEKLEEIFNQCIPRFNNTVLSALKDKNYRVNLLKAYLAKFGEQTAVPQKEPKPLVKNPMPNIPPPQQAQQQPQMQ